MMKIHIFQDAFRSICYTVTPFGLKNAGTTYQLAMNVIFHEHIRKIAECYVDDIAVKNRDKGYHLADLKRVFKHHGSHQLKINPTKSFLEYPISNSLDLSLHPKEFTWMWRRSAPSKRCNFREILKNSEAYKDDWHISRDLYRIFQDIANPSPN